MLVLSVFPGIGLLDRAFEEAGFCVVRGPDVLWGGDVRRFHPPSGVFDGVIGGPPCKRFSTWQRINRKRGFKQAEDLIPEYERVVLEAAPAWFLMENVPLAPMPSINGYTVRDYLFDNRWAGGKQSRRRRFSWGSIDGRKLTLEPALLDDPEKIRCVTASDGRRNGYGCDYNLKPGTLSAKQLSLADTLEAQGLPRDYLKHCPLTKEGSYRVVGNGVPLPMGRVFANAIARACQPAEVSPC